jgi:tRNA(Ile)-lysidine synthase
VSSVVQPHRRGRPSLARKAAELMSRERLFPGGSRTLVMVSGGQDSLALLHLLTSGSAGRFGPASLHVLHINHHLRDDESDADEALVAGACERMGAQLTVVHCPVEKAAGNIQETARDARRRAALEAAAEQGCDRIALGHTADDQVETMLYRLGRYGGLAAFTGMRACDPPWVRPLLSCRREETEAYCRSHGLEFALDRGNAYPGYARTAIREKVLPIWEAGLPGAVEAACRAAEVAAEMQELTACVLAEAVPAVARMASAIGEAEELSCAGLLGLTSPVRRLLVHAWLEARARPQASRAAVLAIESLLSRNGSGERAIGGGCRVRKEYDRLFLERGPCGRLVVPEPVPLPVPGEVGWGGLSVRAEHVARYEAPDVTKEAYLDARSLDGPLQVRGPKTGDRFRPLGSPGTRKLQDLLVDLRVPARERPSWPVVVCGGRIVWVCGLALGEEGRITGGTTTIVRLSLSADLGRTELEEPGKDGEAVRT